MLIDFTLLKLRIADDTNEITRKDSIWQKFCRGINTLSFYLYTCHAYSFYGCLKCAGPEYKWNTKLQRIDIIHYHSQECKINCKFKLITCAWRFILFIKSHTNTILYISRQEFTSLSCHQNLILNNLNINVDIEFAWDTCMCPKTQLKREFQHRFVLIKPSSRHVAGPLFQMIFGVTVLSKYNVRFLRFSVVIMLATY